MAEPSRSVTYTRLRARSSPGTGWSGLQHDLPAGVTARQFPVRLAYLGERVDPSDRDLQGTLVDQGGKLGDYLGRGRLGVAVGLDAVLLCARDVEDGVDAFRAHPEVDGEVDVAAAGGVGERVQVAAG